MAVCRRSSAQEWRQDETVTPVGPLISDLRLTTRDERLDCGTELETLHSFSSVPQYRSNDPLSSLC